MAVQSGAVALPPQADAAASTVRGGGAGLAALLANPLVQNWMQRLLHYLLLFLFLFRF
jgi:hypothetical protein